MNSESRDRFGFGRTRYSLIKRIRQGDDTERRQAVGEFYEYYREPLMRFAKRCLPVSEDVAESAIQEFFVRRVLEDDAVLDGADQEQAGSFRAYLRTAVRWAAKDIVRKETRPHGHIDDARLDLNEREIEGPDLDEATIDRVYAEGLLEQLLRQFRQSTNHWELFRARQLIHPRLPSKEVCERLSGYRNAKHVDDVFARLSKKFAFQLDQLVESHLADATDASIAREKQRIGALLIGSGSLGRILEQLDREFGTSLPRDEASPESLIFETASESSRSTPRLSNEEAALAFLLRPISDYAKFESMNIDSVSFAELFAISHGKDRRVELDGLREIYDAIIREEDADIPEESEIALRIASYALVAKYVAVGGNFRDLTEADDVDLQTDLRKLSALSWLPGTFRECIERGLECLGTKN